jgi:hypothetical protein
MSDVVVPDSDSSQSDKVHSEIVRNRTSFRIVGDDGSIACKRQGADAFSQCEQRDAREEFVECTVYGNRTAQNVSMNLLVLVRVLKEHKNLPSTSVDVVVTKGVVITD